MAPHKECSQILTLSCPLNAMVCQLADLVDVSSLFVLSNPKPGHWRYQWKREQLMQLNITHPTCRTVSKSWDVLVSFHSLWRLWEKRMKKVGKCGSGKNGQNKVGGKCIFAVNQFSWDKKLRSCLLSNSESEKAPQFNSNQSVHAKIQISV